MRFGVVTDIHYADIDPSGARTYRESDDKLAECVQVMNAKRVTFLVELGDFKDQDKTPDESRTLGYLQKIESVMAGFEGPRYHVIGNHDTDSLSKAQYLAAAANTGITPNATRYTFVRAACASSCSTRATRPTAATTTTATSTGATATSTRRSSLAREDARGVARARDRARAPATRRDGRLLREERGRRCGRRSRSRAR